MFSPDLSAFQHVDIIDPNRDLSRDNTVGPGYRGVPRDFTPSRYKREMKKGFTPDNSAERAKPQFGGQKLQTANRVVSHEVRPKARVESVRSVCKERPTDTRPSGGGGGKKAFVPWCDRKRR